LDEKGRFLPVLLDLVDAAIENYRNEHAPQFSWSNYSAYLQYQQTIIYDWIAVRPDFLKLSVMYSFYNNNFRCSVLQFKKVFFPNYITQVSKQVVFCLKFYLTLIEKTSLFLTVELGLTDNRTNLKLTNFPVIIKLCVVQLSDI